MRTSKTTNKIRLFINTLPHSFTLQDAEGIGRKQQLSKRTVNRWLQLSVKESFLLKEQRGIYGKPKVLVTQEKQVSTEAIEQDFDLKNGTGRLSATISFKPRTPEEIVEVLKIDTSVWELERFWNKEKYDGRWLVSALVARKQVKKEDVMLALLQSYKPHYFPIIKPIHINTTFTEPCVGVLSLQDLHFGKDGNDDIKTLFINAIRNLVLTGYRLRKLHKIILVLGGDLLNMDTFNGTTTSGTPVENGLKATQAFTLTLDKYIEAISFCAQFCEELEVVYIPGNHDRLSSYHLAVAISRIFTSNPRITFDVEYAERKAKLYGVNFIGLEHGDTNLKLSPLVFATEFAKLWGQAEFRTIYTGHTHKKKTITYTVEDETNGIDIKTLPSLSITDYYHYHNKWTGNKRRAVFEIHGFETGLLDQLSYVPPKAA